MRLAFIFNICCLALAQGCIPLAPTCKKPPLPGPPPETTCECGVKNVNSAKIVGGQDAAKGEFPWQVGLVK